jgi:hypothetical protein
MKTLSKKMNIPVVWLTPTTINTDALPSEEKKERINEEEMKKLRSLYQSEGVLSAASFVIDGPAFTTARVGESFDGVHYPHQVYSAGAQILCNAMDWLLPVPNTGSLPPPPQPGKMAHEKLGFMMLCLAAAGLFLFDGFMGFSYFAAIFAPGVAPRRLFFEAFSYLHQKKKLPSLEMPGPSSTLSNPQRSSIPVPERRPSADDEEMISLVGKEK